MRPDRSPQDGQDACSCAASTTSISDSEEGTILTSLTIAGSASNVRKTTYKHIKARCLHQNCGSSIIWHTWASPRSCEILSPCRFPTQYSSQRRTPRRWKPSTPLRNRPFEQCSESVVSRRIPLRCAVDRDLHVNMAKQELNLIPVRHLRNTAWHKYATGRAGRGSRFLLG
jgi:hypothetical protein